MPSNLRIGSKVSATVGPFLDVPVSTGDDQTKRVRRHRQRWHGYILRSVDNRKWQVYWIEPDDARCEFGHLLRNEGLSDLTNDNMEILLHRFQLAGDSDQSPPSIPNYTESQNTTVELMQFSDSTNNNNNTQTQITLQEPMNELLTVQNNEDFDFEQDTGLEENPDLVQDEDIIQTNPDNTQIGNIPINLLVQSTTEFRKKQASRTSTLTQKTKGQKE